MVARAARRSRPTSTRSPSAVLWQQDIRKWVHDHNDRSDLEYLLFHAENRAHKLRVELNKKVTPGGLFNANPP